MAHAGCFRFTRPAGLLYCMVLLGCVTTSAQAQNGVTIPQSVLYFKRNLQAYQNFGFNTGACSQYARGLVLQIQRQRVPVSANGTVTTSAYAISTSSSQQSGLGPVSDLITFNLQTATCSIGHAYYPPGQDSQGNYADSPSRTSYTIVSPFTPTSVTATEDGELYLQMLQRLQQYVVLSAYGGALPPSNNDYCQPGAPAAMNLMYDYITSILVYLIPTQRTYNGLPTNTHLLLDPANSETQPLGITEANVIYDGEQRLSVSNASTLAACGRQCYDSPQCSLFVWCPSAKGCAVPGAPRQLLYIPGPTSSAPGTQRGSERCQIFASAQFYYGEPGAVAARGASVQQTSGRAVPGRPIVFDGLFI